MAKVHPTAIIDPQSQLASDAEVGPGCVIQGPVVVGPGCRLIGHVYLQGQVTLGQNNTLYPFACVGFEPQDLKYDGKTRGVAIGNDNVLREGATIHCSTRQDRPTTVGSHNYLMTNTHLAHDVVVGSHCTLASGAVVGGHAVIEDNVFVGGNGAIHQFCRLGRLSFLGGNSALTKDAPPFSIVDCGKNQLIGVNLIGLRRAGVPHKAIDAVKAGFDILYHKAHTNPVAIDLIEQAAAAVPVGGELLLELARFLRGSSRGLCPLSLRLEAGE